jgi:thioredoxin 1
LVASAASAALEIKPFSQDALAAAQKAGRPVAVHFQADWCSTCKLQQRSFEQLKSDGGLDLTVLVASFDDERDLKRRLNVRSQSTLVVFRGEVEKARLAGETSADRIRVAPKSAL